MSLGHHFGVVISRMPHMTYVRTVLASKDCRFLCSACYANCWGVQRRHGETVWLCSRCTDLKDNGLEPGPRLFNTQPSRQLRVGEQLRSPKGVWTVTSSERVKTPEDGIPQEACMYVLTRDNGHKEEWRGRDMADFHLIPNAFEHITGERCAELGSALTAAGLLWEDNGRQDTPRRLKYTATYPRGRQWSIRPVPPLDFDPWQPSNLWRAVCAAPRDQSPVMTARALADYIRELPA
ncbi:hypothetical protein [Streptomyces malaysiensis]|uniref:Uncharacterized protein n=1 Tax=Streptomyces malaysiensis subsp. samsunensis TaxID=459658 RepID=A0A9X2S138_STRMQ|nr:hypothetical protein [Streptomyces samsunensis]MCQ8836100.1 hypothetical protein [Streptomyces samsunensis]